MALPEHVKREAMDAVGHKETTAQIRLYRDNDAHAPIFTDAGKDAPVAEGPIPDHVKKQAMDAVSHKETTAQIRLVKDNGSPAPVATPSRETNKAAEKVARMHEMGHDADSVQRSMTKDNFGRENG